MKVAQSRDWIDYINLASYAVQALGSVALFVITWFFYRSLVDIEKKRSAREVTQEGREEENRLFLFHKRISDTAASRFAACRGSDIRAKDAAIQLRKEFPGHTGLLVDAIRKHAIGCSLHMVLVILAKDDPGYWPAPADVADAYPPNGAGPT